MKPKRNEKGGGGGKGKEKTSGLKAMKPEMESVVTPTGHGQTLTLFPWKSLEIQI